ncbi:MAG: T9SS type A sorting domain-containing protein [Putridiphycobacter sp.]
MKNFIFSLVILMTCSLGNSQTWNYIGGQSSIGQATEMDMVVAENGDLYVFYVDAGTNKGNVKTWNESTQSWELVGLPNFTSANVFDLTIRALPDGTPVVAYKDFYTTGPTTYEIITVKVWGSNTWNNYGNEILWTNHITEYDMNVSVNDGIYLAYYNKNNLVGTQDAYLYLSMSSSGQTQIFTLSDYINNDLSIAIDENETKWEMHGDYDVGITTQFNKYNGSLANGIIDNKGTLMTGMEVRGISGVGQRVVMGTIADDGTGDLDTYVYSDFPTLEATTSYFASTLEFDLAISSTDVTYVFYDKATYYRLYEANNTTGVKTTISTNFGPSAIKNLKVDEENGIIVVAFIDESNNQVEVMEMDNVATVDVMPGQANNLSICGGQNLNVAIEVTDNNYDHSGIGFSQLSDNNALIQSTGLVIGGTYPNYTLYGTSNQVSTNTTVNVTVTLYENSSAVDSDVLSVTLNAGDAINFTPPTSAICQNMNALTLNNFVTPTGGTWSGTGVFNNKFYPSSVNAGTYEVYYTHVNGSGCANTDTFNLNVYPEPVLITTSNNATCGEENGSASVTINGGDPISNYDVYWSNGESDVAIISDLNMGNYYVNVTDVNGCSSSSMATVSSDDVNVSATITDVSCFNGNDGEIDLSISGTGPFVVNWSTGASTEDVSGLSEGPYDVMVTDANGCQASTTLTVSQPNELIINPTVTPANCGSTDGEIAIVVSGGSTPYSFQWYDGNGTQIGTNLGGMTGLSSGAYSAIITDANGCTKVWNGVITEVGGPEIIIESVTDASCLDDGQIDISIASIESIQSIQWSNGEITEDISGLPADIYNVQVTDVNGCVGMSSIEVNPLSPSEQPICLVTVDTITNTNLLVWEKPVTTDISHFNIYRETSVSGVYQLIDQVPYADESVYNDVVASPTVRSWRYKISVVNVCGHEGPKSDVHKTIHLTINQGLGGLINLAWDQYEGFSFSSYDLYRYTDDAGAWTLVQQLPSTNFSFSETPPSANGLNYIISITPPSTCTSTNKAQDWNSSRSNKTSSATNGIEDQMSFGEMSLYPNPTTGELRLFIEESKEILTYRIYDAQGRLIVSRTNGLSQQLFDLSGFESGVYTLVISSDKHVVSQKIIKQ